MAKQTNKSRRGGPDARKTPETAAANAEKTAEAGFFAMALCREDGRFYYVDPTLLRSLSYPGEDVQNLSLYDLLADSHDSAAIAGELRETSGLRERQTALRRADGSIVPVILSIQAVDCGGAANLLVLVREHDACCEKQQQTEAQYRQIFDSVPVGITISDREGRFVAFNPAYSEMMGYSPAELREISTLTLYPTVEERQRFADKLYRDQSVRNHETTLVRKDGQKIDVLLNADLIDFGHLENAMLSSVRDITPLKTIEAKLIQERNFSETILDTSDSLIMVFTKEGRVIKFNKACEQATGYTLADIAGKPFWELVSADPALSQARVRQMVKDRRIGKFESHWKTRNGRRRLISWASMMLTDGEGNDYIVTTGSDITERRKAHEAVRNANRELEKSLRVLEEKNRAISQLADMEGFLQGCRTVEEVCTICAQFAQGICPDTTGAIYLINGANDTAEAQESWGNETVSQTLFTPSDCWSVRRGRPNLIDSDHRGLSCPHINAAADGQYLCVPMEANGEILGVLHLSFVSGDAGDSLSDGRPYFESRLRLLTTAAETAALSLANIMLQNTLRQQSIRDVLTGIYNRRYMEESLTRELSRAQREQASVSVLMIDIDHFKDFNDTYGHDGGDALLRHLGDLFNKNTRGEDILCRFGGEEFVVVLPNTRHQYAVQKAEALRVGVSQLCITHLSSTLRPCTISIGVASFPQNGQTANALIRAADEALYTAKREGRNRVASCQDL